MRRARCRLATSASHGISPWYPCWPLYSYRCMFSSVGNGDLRSRGGKKRKRKKGPSWAILGPSWAILGLSWAILGPSWARHAISYVVVSRRSWYVVLRAISQFVVTRTYLVLCGASPTSWYLVLRGIEAVCGISASSYPVLLGISHFAVARTF